MVTPLDPNARPLVAGAASVDLTPSGSVFLFGYPHVPRYSTGVHDKLTCSALYLRAGDDPGRGGMLVLANDLIFVDRALAATVRGELSRRTGLSTDAIAITATHTHSGPLMLDYLSNAADPVVPKTDPAYVNWVGQRMIEAGSAAHAAAQPAEFGLVVARVDGIGTNRHDKAGPADPEVPVLLVRSARDRQPIGCMVVYAMHPTVLHEDSTLISGDFPHFFREYLWRTAALPRNCPILYLNGASGDQSPRHVTTANTFAEAQRLGERMGRFVADALPALEFQPQAVIEARTRTIELKPRQLPTLAEATENAKRVRGKFESLRRSGAPRPEVRTAECDLFGAEECVELARAAADGRLEKAIASCSPAEVQVIRVGRWRFAFWPGEFFVDYALELRARCASTFVVTFANGELQGYLVTPDAVDRGIYEAGNALFCATNGRKFIETTLSLLHTVK